MDNIDWNKEMLNMAIWYATKWEWRVIPLHSPQSGGSCSCSSGLDCKTKGKHPRISDWISNSSNDVKVIRGWFEMWPDMNIGIHTGPESGVVVIDVDGDKGRRSLYGLENNIPHTVTSKSGNGLHYLFACPDEPVKTTTGVYEGIDSRGSGGFIVAPPSLHASGIRYEWTETPELAPCPKWWLEAIDNKGKFDIQEVKYDVKITHNKNIDTYGRNALQKELATLLSTPIGKGMRNSQLNNSSYKIARLVAGGCIERDFAYKCLLEAALGIEMDEREAVSTINSAMKRGLQRPRYPAS